jgi:hypothetical protein
MPCLNSRCPRARGRRCTSTASRPRSSLSWRVCSRLGSAIVRSGPLPGALAVGPRDIPQTFRNVGPTLSKLLLTVILGRFSKHFLEVDGRPDEDLDTIKALCAKYDVEVLK